MNRSKVAQARKLVTRDTREIAAMVEGAIGAVGNSRMSPSQGRAIASLVTAWVRLHELALEEGELAELRSRLEGRQWAG